LKSVILLFELYIDKDMTLQKQLEYIHREFLVDTQWVEDELKDPKTSIAEIDYDSGSRKEMKKETIKKTSTVLFATSSLLDRQ
jgi:hypothetical protein